MATINQKIKQGKQLKKNKSKKTTILDGAPAMSGICTAILTATPKKPNSAVRKIAKVKLSNGKIVKAYIKGEGGKTGHPFKEHSKVLIKGGGPKDLNGIKLHIVRGVFQDDERKGVIDRKTSRSKYGTPKPKSAKKSG